MKRIHQAAIAASIAVAIIIGNGCGQKESTTGGAPTKIEVSAEKNSFKEVTSKLDAGGNLYVYLSTEEWLNGLSDKVSGWRDFVKDLPNVKADDQKNIERGFDVATSLIKNSGIEDISGVGMSSISREKGIYHSKFVLHHYPGKGAGYLWTLFGKTPHALNGQDYLPASTVFATFSDLDMPLAWSVLDKEIGDSGIPGAKEALEKLPEQFAAATGLQLDAVLASLGNEYGLVITLDESRKIALPFSSPPLEVPEPGIMIVVKVKSDVIFNRVDELLKGKPQVVSSDKDGVKMRTMPIPLPLPISLRPSMARSGDYLFLASSDTLIEEALAVKGGKKPGLKSIEEFKRLTKGMPEQGNQFTYVSARFGETWKRVQGQFMEGKTEDKPGQAELVKKLMSLNSPTFTYTVMANTDEGWVGVGNGNQNPAKMVLLPAIALPAVAAGVALPAFAKAKEKGQSTACINNLRRIDGAKAQWALENKKGADDVPTWADLIPALQGKGKLTCPGGGVYSINKLSEAPTCSIPGHSLDK